MMRRFLTTRTLQHGVGVMAVLVYLNSTERTRNSTGVQEKCILFGSENENF